jgi:hypothetical protein
MAQQTTTLRKWWFRGHASTYIVVLTAALCLTVFDVGDLATSSIARLEGAGKLAPKDLDDKVEFEMVTRATASCHRARLGIPDAGGVLGDRAVARESSGTGNVQDRFARPSVLVGMQLGKPPVGVEIRLQIGQVHVKVATRQERVA